MTWELSSVFRAEIDLFQLEVNFSLFYDKTVCTWRLYLHPQFSERSFEASMFRGSPRETCERKEERETRNVFWSRRFCEYSPHPRPQSVQHERTDILFTGRFRKGLLVLFGKARSRAHPVSFIFQHAESLSTRRRKTKRLVLVPCANEQTAMTSRLFIFFFQISFPPSFSYFASAT